jgi:cytochrome bd-type quinol oxidase subunit 2
MRGLVSAVHAQEINLTPSEGSNISGLTVDQIIQWLISITFIVAGIVFLFMLVIGGIRWIISGGDKANTESARNQVTAALIGLIIVFSAWAIANLLGGAFGVEILNLEIPGVAG